MSAVAEAKGGASHGEDEFAAQESTFDGTVSTKERRFRLLDPDSLPVSFSTNTNREDLVLEYVSNFEAQINEIAPKRTGRVLFSPFNECDVRKFICTTIRPTELPFRELYHADAAAQFVADLIDYEPLDPPTEVPDRVPSSYSVLKWRVGDSFDFSILLTSFLVGAGYDAYCVQGYAPKWITLRDQSHLQPPFLAEPDPDAGAVGKAEEKDDGSEGKDAKGEDDGKYRVRRHGVPTSNFEAAQAQKKEQRRIDAVRAAKADADSESDVEDDLEADDPLDGQRVHCWVLVRAGERGVEQPYFIEATTGARYATEEAPYTGIEAVYSSKNHYINMQDGIAVRDLSWDLSNNEEWENVFIPPLMATEEGDEGEAEGEGNGMDDLTAAFGEGKDDEGGNGEGKDGEDVDDSAILDLPASWVPQLSVPHQLYQARFWAGEQKVVLFRRAKHERFAAYGHPQGLTERLSLFKDGRRTVPKEVRETFANRRDKLVWRLRQPLAGLTVEVFFKGRPDALRERRECHGRLRELVFYGSARGDGLVRRTDEIGSKSVMLFEGRDDNLLYRSVRVTEDREEAGESQFELPGEDGGPQQYITKMTEKFAPDESKDPAERVQKQTYYCSSGRIRTIFHYAPMRVTAAVRQHYKNPDRAPAAATIHTFDGTGAGATLHSEVDHSVQRPSSEELAESFNEVMAQEKECNVEVRSAAREVTQLLELRKSEARRVLVDKTMFDTALDKALANIDLRNESQAAAQEEEESGETDYLAPFLPSAPGDKGLRDLEADPLTSEEAQRAAKNCLEALKERLLERANIIQKRLDVENQNLAKKQAAFQRSQQRDDQQAGDEEFERFCSETMFRIQILEQRLVQHEKTAMQKYTELDQMLHSDPRLAALGHHR